MTTTEEINHRTDGPVHLWFELSYSNYAVLHRTLMQSMPVEWQERMVRCLEELDDAFSHIERAPGYEVKACRWAEPWELSPGERDLTRVTFDEDTETYYDERGTELNPHSACVAVPVHEPVPHYNRGRTFIEPRVS